MKIKKATTNGVATVKYCYFAGGIPFEFNCFTDIGELVQPEFEHKIREFQKKHDCVIERNHEFDTSPYYADCIVPNNNTYSPKRLAREWTDGAPDEVLACYDEGGNSRTYDRYTVVCGGDMLYPSTNRNLKNCRVPYLGMSDNFAVSMWGEFSALEFIAYRKSRNKKRVPWAKLPPHIKKHVERRLEE